jgi:hypothetical protein
MHVLINVKSPNNISKWQMGFNSAFKGLKSRPHFSIAVTRPIDYWDGGFESLPVHGCSSHVFVVSCKDSGPCDEPITSSEESHRVCDLETSTMRWPSPNCVAARQKNA